MESILRRVPDYQEFFTVNEMNERSFAAGEGTPRGSDAL